MAKRKGRDLRLLEPMAEVESVMTEEWLFETGLEGVETVADAVEGLGGPGDTCVFTAVAEAPRLRPAPCFIAAVLDLVEGAVNLYTHTTNPFSTKHHWHTTTNFFVLSHRVSVCVQRGGG